MPYCPHCEYEYEAGVTRCADCGRSLVAERPPAPPVPPLPGGHDALVYATNVPNAIIGNLLINQLKNAGIPAMMRRSPVSDIGEWSHNDFVMHDVLVNASQLEEARLYIHSPPGTPYGGGAEGAEWEPITFGAEAEADPGPEPADGWQSLPSERDYLQQRTLRKTHGTASAWDMPTRTWRDGDPDDEDDEVRSPDITRSRLFRAIAGLLFLAASLPWILQIFQNMGDWLRR